MNSRHVSARIAVVAALALSAAVGGVVMAAPANADDLPFAISTPIDGESVLAGTITVTGTGTAGDTVGVAAPEDVYTGGQGVVDSTGHWTTTFSVPFSASGPRQIQAIDEDSFDGPSIQDDVVTVNLTPQSDLLRVTSPVSDSSSPSRTVTFEGTAPAGSVVHLDSNGEANNEPDATVGSTGIWSITTTFETGNPENELLTSGSVTFTGQDPTGVAFVPQSVTDIALPAPAPTPVIDGVSSAGPKATVTGTAIGGPAVALFFSPVDDAARTAANLLPEGSFESTGIVDSAGRYTASTTLAAGQWKVTAVVLDSTDVHSASYLSLASAATPFALTAAAPATPADPVAAPVPGASPSTAAAAGSGELAFTGSPSPAPGFVGGAALVLAGLVLVIARRRREAGARS